MKTRLMFVAGLLCLTASLYANPGFITLEGTDATASHGDLVYTPQLLAYLEGTSILPVLVYNKSGFGGTVDLSTTDGGIPIQTTTDLSTVTLANYSAIYIESPGGCCTADNTVLTGFGTAINAFIAGGGNLAIENYIGGTYDGVVPGGAAPAGTILGVGVGGDTSYCSDGEVVTAAGLAAHFTQPVALGCWTHQGYENAYWVGTQHYISLMDSPTDATDAAAAAASGQTAVGGFTFADATQAGSSLLTIQGSPAVPVTSAVPEPGTVGLLGGTLVALVAGRKRLAARLQ